MRKHHDEVQGARRVKRQIRVYSKWGALIPCHRLVYIKLGSVLDDWVSCTHGGKQ